jgi:hypothetical protein
MAFEYPIRNADYLTQTAVTITTIRTTVALDISIGVEFRAA